MYHCVISGSCLRNRGYVSNRDVFKGKLNMLTINWLIILCFFSRAWGSCCVKLEMMGKCLLKCEKEAFPIFVYYSFSRLLKHIFLKHASFPQNSKHKSQNHSHKMQNPLYILQKATLLSKQCYVTSKGYFVF